VDVAPSAEIVDVAFKPAQVGKIRDARAGPWTQKITGSASGQNFLMSPQVSAHAINTRIARGNR
jgi:hypothetical protein